MIPHTRVTFDESDKQLVTDILTSGKVAAGERVRAFERAWADYVVAEDAAMVASGTVALCLALRALDIGEHQWVDVSPYCCTAVHSAVEATGASFTWLRPKAKPMVWPVIDEVITAPLFGRDWKDESASILDMSHRPHTQLTRLAIASLGPTKAIRATSGGIVSGKKNLIEKIKHMRECRDKPASGETLNLMPTEIDAALAHRSLENHEIDREQRAIVASRYDAYLYELEKAGKIELPGSQSYYYRYVVKLKDRLAKDVSAAMKERGVFAEQPIWDYREKPLGIAWADEAFDRNLSLPLWPGMDKSTIGTVVKTLGEVL